MPAGQNVVLMSEDLKFCDKMSIFLKNSRIGLKKHQEL